MKWWVIGLLVANIAYFAWEYDRQITERRAAPPAVRPIPEGVEPLKLISELDKPPPLREEEAEPEPQVPQDVADAEKPAPPAPAAISPVPTPKPAESPPPPAPTAAIPQVTICLLAGPFSSERDAVSAQKWFEDRKMQTRRHTEDKADSKLFWVYLEPQSSHLEAQEKVEDLKRKGLQDFFIIRNGEMRNAISLGVYGNQDSVNRRLAELKGEGYRPLVVPRGTGKSVYWVDAWGKQDRKALLAEARKRLSKRVAESDACGEIAARSANP